MSRTAIFIDGLSLYGAGKAMGFDIDYKALIGQLLDAGDRLVGAHYYTVTAEDGGFEAVLPLLDFLEYNGFRVRTKPGHPYTDRESGARRVRGNMHTELAVEAMGIADHFDTAILISGDENLVALIEGLQRCGKRVVLVSTIKTSPHQCADELRRAADQFLDLETLRAKITRAPRAAKETVQA